MGADNITSELEDKLDDILGGALFVFIGIILTRLISLLIQLLVARSLGPGTYGLIVLSLMVLTVSTRILRFGIPSGLTRYLPRVETEPEKIDVMKSGFTLSLPVTIPAAVLLYLSAEYIGTVLLQKPGTVPLIQIFSFALPFSVLMRVVIGGLRGYKKAREKVLTETVQVSGILLPVAILFFLGYTALISVTVIWALSFLWGSFVGLILLLRQTDTIRRYISVKTSYKQELFSFSLPLMLSASVTTIMRNVDTFMIGYYLPSADVGLYNIGYMLSNTILIPLSFLGFIYGPIASELEKDGNKRRLRRILLIVNRWGVIFVFPGIFLFVVYGAETIQVLFGSEYVSADTTLQLLTLGYLAHLVNGKSGETLKAGGYTRMILLATFSAAVVNVSANILLIPVWGIEGAAIATGGSYFIMGVLIIFTLMYFMNISPIGSNYIVQIILGIVTGLIVFGINKLAVTPRATFIFVLWNILAFYGIFGLLNTILGSWELEDKFLWDYGIRVVRTVLRNPIKSD